jgi:microcystin-dependent protein
MGQPYVGEIRIFAGNFPPAGWMFCQGATLPISENEVLFQLIGTTYGGDGQETFNLPNLASRVPIHVGTNPSTGTTYQIGESGGAEQVTITQQTTPIHNHPLLATSTAQTNSPANAYFAVATSSQAGVLTYVPPGTPVALAPTSVAPIGGNQPHTNIQPTLAVNFIISLFGVFPTQS